MVYVIGFPVASFMVIDVFCSGFKTSAIFMTGFKCVAGSSTIIGIIPYILIGKSLIVCECFWSNVTFI